MMTMPRHTIASRICKTCHEEKPLTEFALWSTRLGTHRPVCKSCIKVLWPRSQESLERKRERDRLRVRPDRSGKPNPEHNRVRAKLNEAVKAGKVIKPAACSECAGTGKRIEAHHDDYSRPLDVVWLCTLCHGKRRRKH